MSLGSIFPGDLGITQTVNALVYAVKFSVSNFPQVRKRAESIVASCAERDEQCEVSKIFNWVLKHYRYLSDPVFLEHIKSPEIIDGEINMFGAFQGDCDDVAGYLAALLISVGYRVEFVVISLAGKGDEFRHIFLRFYSKRESRWVALEGTARSKPIGWEPPHVRIKEFFL